MSMICLLLSWSSSLTFAFAMYNGTQKLFLNGREGQHIERKLEMQAKESLIYPSHPPRKGQHAIKSGQPVQPVQSNYPVSC